MSIPYVIMFFTYYNLKVPQLFYRNSLNREFTPCHAPICLWLIKNKKITSEITHGGSLEAELFPGAVKFSIYGDKLLTENVAAWTPEGAEQVWPWIDSAYYRMVGSRDFRSSRGTFRPTELPWFATVVHPSPEAEKYAKWLEAFSQDFPLTVISLSSLLME